MYWKEREGKILFLILIILKLILILKMQNFAAFEFNIINSHQFLLIHIFFPKYARNEWPCKRIKLCKDTCVKSSCKYRRALFDCHRPQRCFRIGCVKRKKKRISELFVGGCYCEQTISNEKVQNLPRIRYEGPIDRCFCRMANDEYLANIDRRWWYIVK